jgi:hypothetical protein
MAVTFRLTNVSKTIDISLITDLPAKSVGKFTILNIHDDGTVKKAAELGFQINTSSVNALITAAASLDLKLERYDSAHAKGGTTIMDYTSGYGYGDGIGIDLL